MTPCMLAKTILGMTESHLPHSTLIFVAITLGYLLFAVKAVSEARVGDVESEEANEMLID